MINKEIRNQKLGIRNWEVLAGPGLFLFVYACKCTRNPGSENTALKWSMNGVALVDAEGSSSIWELPAWTGMVR